MEDVPEEKDHTRMAEYLRKMADAVEREEVSVYLQGVELPNAVPGEVTEATFKITFDGSL